MLYNLIQNIKVALALLLGYSFVVTFAGAFKAWVAKKMGDYTAEYNGFLTLDPLAHIDVIGMVLLLTTGFGWGREVPVNVHNIYPPRRTAKILAVFYSSTIMHILLGVVAIVCIVGLNVLQSLYIGPSTVIHALMFVLQGALNVNIFLSMLRFIQASIDLLFMHAMDRHPEHVVYIQIGSLIATLLLLLFLGRQIQLLFSGLIVMLSGAIVSFFG